MEQELNMDGAPVTVATLAWIAHQLEKHGSVRVTNCAIANTPGIASVYLGAELQRLGFFDEVFRKA
jgi:hypothetical protein